VYAAWMFYWYYRRCLGWRWWYYAVASLLPPTPRAVRYLFYFYVPVCEQYGNRFFY